MTGYYPNRHDSKRRCPDRHERGEDFSEGPGFPDELKVCGCCQYCDSPDQAVYLRTPGGFKARGGQCLYPACGCTDFETGCDILDGAVFVAFTGRPCPNFEPTAEALAAAADAAEYERDPYAYNGVNEGRDFY